jgi:hypothetical protein
MYTVYDRIFGDFPAKNTVCTPYIYGSGQPSKYASRVCDGSGSIVWIVCTNCVLDPLTGWYSCRILDSFPGRALLLLLRLRLVPRLSVDTPAASLSCHLNVMLFECPMSCCINVNAMLFECQCYLNVMLFECHVVQMSNVMLFERATVMLFACPTDENKQGSWLARCLAHLRAQELVGTVHAHQTYVTYW